MTVVASQWNCSLARVFVTGLELLFTSRASLISLLSGSKTSSSELRSLGSRILDNAGAETAEIT
jgi:hypothetical protein